MSVVALVTVFSACSAKEETETTSSTAVGEVPTQEAVVKEADAVNFIEQSYTKEELGLDKVEKDYSMMVASNGVDIDGDKYVKVVANVIVRNDTTNEEGKETFSMETMGEYFISFDAETVLMKDRQSGEYVELENRYDDFVAKSETTTETATEVTSHQH